MSIYWKNFEIDLLPTPPTGYNQGSQPPGEELVTSTSIKTYTYAAWQSDTLSFSMEINSALPSILNTHDLTIDILVYILGSIMEEFNNLFKFTTSNGNQVAMSTINFDLVSQTLKSHFYYGIGSYRVDFVLPESLIDCFHFNTVTVKAIFGWDQIYSDNVQKAQTTFGKQVTEGVTTTDSETKEFTESIGITQHYEANLLFLKASTELSLSFSAKQSYSHSITLSKAVTKTRQWTIGENTFYQLWQLYVKFANDDGKFIRQNLDRYQLLTYPHETNSMVMQLPEGFECEATEENLKAHIKTKFGIDLDL